MSKKVIHGLLFGGLIVIVVGLITFFIIFAINGFSLSQMAGVTKVEEEYVITEDFNNLDLNVVSSDVVIKPATDDKVTLKSKHNNKIVHTFEVKNDTLVIRVKDDRRWFNYIGFNTFYLDLALELSLPKKLYNDVKLETVSSNLTVTDLASVSLNAKTVSGNIKLENTNSDLASRNDFKDLTLKTVSGNISLTNLTGNNLKSETVSGTHKLNNVILNEKLTLNSTSGNMNFSGDAKTLDLKSISGSLTLELLTNKVYSVKSTTGKITLPESLEAGSLCKLETVNGNIKVSLK